MTTWLITGCSTGLGRALAEAVLGRGWNAVVTARDPSAVQDLADAHPDTALAVALDVTDPGQVQAAVDAATVRFGALDVLVNNAGYGYRLCGGGGGGRRRPRTVRHQRARRRRDGQGRAARDAGAGQRRRGEHLLDRRAALPPGSGYYAATKLALEGITGSMRAELAPLGSPRSRWSRERSAPTSPGAR